MSQEAIQSNPVEASGLSPEQIEHDAQLRIDAQEAHKNLKYQEYHRDDYSRQREAERLSGHDPLPIDVASTLQLDEAAVEAFNIVDHAIKKHAANKTGRAARRNYRQNAAAFQTQAQREATAAGQAPKGWTQE